MVTGYGCVPSQELWKWRNGQPKPSRKLLLLQLRKDMDAVDGPPAVDVMDEQATGRARKSVEPAIRVGIHYIHSTPRLSSIGNICVDRIPLPRTFPTKCLRKGSAFLDLAEPPTYQSRPKFPATLERPLSTPPVACAQVDALSSHPQHSTRSLAPL